MFTFLNFNFDFYQTNMRIYFFYQEGSVKPDNYKHHLHMFEAVLDNESCLELFLWHDSGGICLLI